ncbi:hypothetical protein ACFQZ4_46495 [Catellatospora coxensis]
MRSPVHRAGRAPEGAVLRVAHHLADRRTRWVSIPRRSVLTLPLSAVLNLHAPFADSGSTSYYGRKSWPRRTGDPSGTGAAVVE